MLEAGFCDSSGAGEMTHVDKLANDSGEMEMRNGSPPVGSAAEDLPPVPPASAAEDPRLDDMLDRWETLHEQGTPISVEELCKDVPELIAPLAERVRVLRAMGMFLEAAAPPAALEGRGESSPRPAGRYDSLSFHAAGGLGEIYRAQDTELQREVAIKRIQPRWVRDSESRRRFELEAEITGKLEHPGVVPVYGFGRDTKGQPYYAMRFIRGETLTDAINRFHREQAKSGKKLAGQRSLEFQKMLRAFLAACQTIAYAHSRRIIHRDVKPGNIMLGKYGETLVVDWGLAKPMTRGEQPVPRSTIEESLGSVVSSDSQFSVGGSAKGSPAYMSPEQAAGDENAVGPPADIYSLGATLYHILTGRKPFEGSNLLQVLDRVQRGEFLRPSQVISKTPKPLEAICLKAMATKPEDRYASAQDLAADVEHWLADEPVVAWKEPVSARAWRWVRRHRTLVTSAALALIVGFGVLSSMTAHLNQKNDQLNVLIRQKDGAILEKDAAIEEKDSAIHAKDAAIAEKGAAYKKLDEINKQLVSTNQNLVEKEQTNQQQLKTIGKQQDEISRRQKEIEQRSQANEAQALELVKIRERESQSKAEALDARKSAERERDLAQRNFATARKHQYLAKINLAAWNLADGGFARAEQFLREERPEPGDLTDRRQFEWYHLWGRLNVARSIHEVAPGTAAIAVSPNGELAATLRRGDLTIYDATTGKTLAEWTELPEPVSIPRFSPDGKFLAVLVGGRYLRMLDPRNPQKDIHPTVATLQEGATTLAVHPTRPIIATADVTGHVRLTNITSGEEIEALETRTEDMRGLRIEFVSLEFSADGTQLAAAISYPRKVFRWNVANLLNVVPAQTREFGASNLGSRIGAQKKEADVETYPGNSHLLRAGFLRLQPTTNEPDKPVRSQETPFVVLSDDRRGIRIILNPRSNTPVTLRPRIPATVRGVIEIRGLPRGDGLLVLAENRVFLLPNLGMTVPSDSTLLDRLLPRTRNSSYSSDPAETAIPVAISESIVAMAISGDQTTVGLLSQRGLVEWIDVPALFQARTIVAHTSAIDRIAFSSDGQHLFSSDFRGDLRQTLFNKSKGKSWSTSQFTPPLVIGRRQPGVRFHSPEVVVAPDGKSMAIGSPQAIVLGHHRLPDDNWRTITRQPSAHHNASFPPLLTFTRDSRLLLFADPVAPSTTSDSVDELSSAVLRVWDLASNGERVRYGLDNFAPRCMAISPDGKLLTVCSGKKIRVVPFAPPAVSETALKPLPAAVRELQVGDAEFCCMTFLNQGRQLAAIDAGGSLHVWETAQWTLLLSTPAHSVSATGLVASSDNRTLFTAGRDGKIKVWDIEDRIERYTIDVGMPISALNLSPDEDLVAVGCEDGSIRLFDRPDNPQIVAFTRKRAAQRPNDVGAQHDHVLACWGAYLALPKPRTRQQALPILNEARSLLEKLEKSGPADPRHQRWRAAIDREISDHFLGNPERAR